MRVLIVDDEVFTRMGIINKIPWSTFGEVQLEQAFDGVNALEKAKNFLPDILITDVRMPRMNGIDLAIKLRELNPKCKIIFMSGYSDKEYLKSAISIGAEEYIEKPINIKDFQATLKKVFDLHESEEKINVYIEASTSFIKDQLALELIKPNTTADFISKMLSASNYKMSMSSDFITVLIKLFDPLNQSINITISQCENLFKDNSYESILCAKDSDTIVLHIYCTLNEKNLMNSDNFLGLVMHLSEIAHQNGNFFLSCGEKVSGIFNVYKSYQGAKQSLNKSFFYQYNSQLLTPDKNSLMYTFNEQDLDKLNLLIQKEKKHEFVLLLKQITQEITHCHGTSLSYIKDIYYKISLLFVKFTLSHRISIDSDEIGGKSLFEQLESFHNIITLENYILERINLVFQKLQEKNSNADSVSCLLKYIHENYGDENLSISQISEHVFLSMNYISTLFKDQVGITLNQYITEYRLEKAKELLLNSELKVNDISAKVGYSDSNYFAKIFKKINEQTPSDYRKRHRM